MAGILIILPIFALDIWLMVTTGRRQLKRWREQKLWQHIVSVLLMGIGLGVWFAFFLHYGSDEEMRTGFPVPVRFFRPEDRTWAYAAVPPVVLYGGFVVNLLTGLAAPFVPFKIAEFLKQVKAEL